jgi:hypothetical protein
LPGKGLASQSSLCPVRPDQDRYHRRPTEGSVQLTGANGFAQGSGASRPASAAVPVSAPAREGAAQPTPVRVTRQISYQRGGGHSFAPPKSRAGRRLVSYPSLIAADLSKHVDALNSAAVLVFTSPAQRSMTLPPGRRRAFPGRGVAP